MKVSLLKNRGKKYYILRNYILIVRIPPPFAFPLFLSVWFFYLHIYYRHSFVLHLRSSSNHLHTQALFYSLSSNRLHISLNPFQLKNFAYRIDLSLLFHNLNFIIECRLSIIIQRINKFQNRSIININIFFMYE